MVLELAGDKKKFRQGVRYLKNEGIQVDYASQEIQRDKKKCTHCGACTAVCPTGALSVQRPKMTVRFDHQEVQHLRTLCSRLPDACNGGSLRQPDLFRMKPTVAVAVSGGVDSLMAAYLLKEHGHPVVGLHFLTGYESEQRNIESIADQLDIPLHISI